MNELLLQELLQKYVTETLSEEELKTLRELLTQPESNTVLDRELEALFSEQMQQGYTLPEVDERMRNHVMSRLHTETPIRRIPVHRWGWVAACLALLVSAGTYFFTRTQQPAGIAAEIAPGKDGAILTLADGSEISLDTIQNGTIALQGGAAAIVVNGRLTYQVKGGEMVYNKMSTPKGRQFQLTLPDGTKVWLNAASSIRYPTVFTGRERLVEVTGEAYFEVAQLTSKPFRVNANHKATVEVLGTHFNVNAYDNETSINTTLLEGSVRVSKGNESSVILPGEQAQVNGTIQIVKNVNTKQVIAWKDGLFNFDGASLQAVMRQLERWYDIEVIYEQGIPDIKFGGKMTRGMTLKGVLSALEKSDVHFRIEGRTLTVLP